MSQGGLVWPWAASAAQQGSRCLQAPLYWICKTKTFKLAEGHLKSLQRFSELIWAALSQICASVRGKIKNKVFERMLSPFNPSHAQDSISWSFSLSNNEAHISYRETTVFLKLYKQSFTCGWYCYEYWMFSSEPLEYMLSFKNQTRNCLIILLDFFPCIVLTMVILKLLGKQCGIFGLDWQFSIWCLSYLSFNLSETWYLPWTITYQNEIWYTGSEHISHTQPNPVLSSRRKENCKIRNNEKYKTMFKKPQNFG